MLKITDFPGVKISIDTKSMGITGSNKNMRIYIPNSNTEVHIKSIDMPEPDIVIDNFLALIITRAIKEVFGTPVGESYPGQLVERYIKYFSAEQKRLQLRDLNDCFLHGKQTYREPWEYLRAYLDEENRWIVMAPDKSSYICMQVHDKYVPIDWYETNPDNSGYINMDYAKSITLEKKKNEVF